MINTEDTRTRGLLQEIIATQVLGLKGQINVEMVDERGKVCSRHTAPNYMNTALWQRFVKTVQRSAWSAGMVPLDANITLDPDYGRDPRQISGMPNEILTCWEDSTPENTADIHSWGEVKAWAHRWAQASPSTRQGIVNPALCAITETQVKWVFEWTTTNGNGTFQSVGFRRVFPVAITGDTTLYDWARWTRRLFTATGWVVAGTAITSNPTGGLTSSGAACTQAFYYDSASGKLWAVLDSTGNRRLFSCPVTLSPGRNYQLGAVTDEFANVLAAGLGGDAVAAATRHTYGLTRLGAAGDWIAVGTTGSTTARRPFIRRVTAAGAITYTNANAATFTTESAFWDVTYDGTDIWAIGQIASGVTTRMYRIDPATGTISATVTITPPARLPSVDGAVGANAVEGIEWDAANSCFWLTDRNNYLYAVDSSGNPLGPIYNTLTPPAITLGAPFSQSNTQSNGRSLNDMDQWRFINGSSGVSTTDPYSQTAAHAGATDVVGPGGSGGIGRRLVTIDGNIWRSLAGLSSGQNNISQWAFASFDDDPQLMSRSLLGSPATKTSTQTMRITYTIEFT